MEIKIFRANRGEGKTEWLVDRGIEAIEAGYELIYVGADQSAVNNMWMSKMHEMCPAKQTYRVFEHKVDNSVKYCFLTDDLMDNLSYASSWRTLIKNLDGLWYITMNAEDFVG